MSPDMLQAMISRHSKAHRFVIQMRVYHLTKHTKVQCLRVENSRDEAAASMQVPVPERSWTVYENLAGLSIRCEGRDPDPEALGFIC